MHTLLNNVSSRLAAAAASGATSYTVTAGEGALFGSPSAAAPVRATISKVSGYLEIAWKIVDITNVTGDVLTTVEKEGTSGLSFSIGDKIDVRWTAGLVRLGTATNDDAAVGNKGEIVTSHVASASAVSLTTVTPANVTSISLTAGDWDLAGMVNFLAAASTSITIMHGAPALTSATLPSDEGASGLGADCRMTNFIAAFVPGVTSLRMVLPTVRLSIAATTTVYLVAQATFTADTLKAWGGIRARRIR